MNTRMKDAEYRAANVACARGDTSVAQRQKLYTLFNESYNFDLDVLLFVEALKQGWDAPPAKKLINAAPTLSDWVVEQLMGRVLRPFQRYNGEIVTAEIVDFIDRSKSDQVSAVDILNRDAPSGMRYREGAIIGKDLVDLRHPSYGAKGAFEPIPQPY